MHIQRWRCFSMLVTIVMAAAATADGASPAYLELGKPLIQVFGPVDHDGDQQTWGIDQSSDGVMWFANNDALLRFDGERWTKLPMPNESIVRSVSVGDDGRVWVGGVGELGMLETRADGELVFVSLLDRLPVEERDFGDVWRTFAVPGGALFWAGDRFLLWRDERFRVLRPETSRVPWKVGDEVLVNLAEGGLHRLEGSELVAVPGAADTADIKVMVMLRHPSGDLVLGTRAGELYRLHLPQPAEGDVVRPRLERWRTEIDDVLAAGLYHGAVTPTGELVLATPLRGAFVLDGLGRLVLRLDREDGLPDRSVWYAHVDREHGLWLALNRGLARVDRLTGLGAFDERAGLEGTVEAVRRHGGRLYAGTSSGLYVLEGNRFNRVGGVAPPCWSLAEDAERRLLVGTSAGLFEVADGIGRSVLSLPSSNVFAVTPSRQWPGLYLVGSMRGLMVVRRASGAWEKVGTVAGVGREVRCIAEEADGALWVGTMIDGVARVELGPGGDPATARVTRIGLEDGLPTLRSVKVAVLDGEVLLGSEKGLFRWLPGQGVLRDDRFGGSPPNILRLLTTTDGSLWMSRDREDPAVLRPVSGAAAKLETIPLRLPPVESVQAIWPDDDGVVWFGSATGLRRWAPGREITSPPSLPPRIGRVLSGVGLVRPDGRWPEAEQPDPNVARRRRTGRVGLSLPFAENDLTIEFAALRFSGSAEVRYSSRLEGLEDSWSPWTDEAKRVFTNLHEGSYRLRVRSRDASGATSPETVFAFVIRPPWYRHPAIVLLYAIVAVLMMVGIVRLRSRALERENLRLEAMVAERTSELARRARELEAARGELEAFSFAVSHDLQAPLRRIEGFSQLLEEDLGPRLAPGEGRLVARIRANCRDMSALIEALLRLSRLSRAEVVPIDVDLGAVAREILATLTTAAPGRRFRWSVEDGLVVRADPTLLRVVVTNLLENAVKFTARREEARIEVRRQEAPERPGQTVVTIADNGVGFDPAYAGKLFAPFARLHGEAEFPGTGIGLATVRRLLHRQGGEIWAESQPEKGAVFSIALPAP